MKEITMFMQATCPHCKRARAMIEKLLAAHPEYSAIPFKMIDERKEHDLAAKYDYYYVPTFYVGEEKLHEGVPTEAAIEKVFKTAYEG